MPSAEQGCQIGTWRSDMMNGQVTAEQPSPWWVRLIIGRRPIWTVVRLIFWITIPFVTFRFVLIPVRVKGESMHPTFRDGSIHFIYRHAYKDQPPSKGDLIGLIDPSIGSKALVLKRILATPGQRFGIRRGVIYIDGEPYKDQFSDSPIYKQEMGGPILENYPPRRLGKDQYFAVGDNRSISMFYVISRELIVGKVIY